MKLGRDNGCFHTVSKLKERGATLVFFAVSLPVLILFVGMVIDLARWTISFQQARGFARLIALAAVEDYFDTASLHLSSRDRLLHVRNRVNELAKGNSVVARPGDQPRALVLLGEPVTDQTGGILTPGRWYSSPIPENYCRDLEKRKWGEECSECKHGQCNPCPGGVLPCFVGNSIADLRGSPAFSAFQVQASFYDSLLTQFLKVVLGSVQTTIDARATAATHGQHIFFLVDASGSMTNETHRSYRSLFTNAVPSKLSQPHEYQGGQAGAPEEGRGSRFAFYLTADNCPGQAPVPPDENGCCPTCATLTYGTEEGPVCPPCEPAWRDYMSDDWHWRFLTDFEPLERLPTPYTYLGRFIADGGPMREEGPSILGVAVNDTMHFKDDYESIIPVFDYDNPGVEGIRPELHPKPQNCEPGNPESPQYCAPWEQFRIDTYCDRTNACPGPQPLTDVFKAISTATTVLQSRLLAQDMAGMFFFGASSAVPWTRFLRLSAEYDYLQKVASTPRLRQALKMFPGRDRFTDLPDAFSRALAEFDRVLKEDPSQRASQAIILASDGLTNCTPQNDPRCDQTLMQRFDFNRDGVIDQWDLARFLQCFKQQCDPKDKCKICFSDPDDYLLFMSVWGCTAGCSNRYEFYDRSFQYIRELAPKLKDAGVAVHIIPVGSHIMPNLIDLKNPKTGRCYSDSEARELKLDLVQGGMWSEIQQRWVSCSEDPQGCELAYLRASPEHPFPQASKNLYDIARATGGQFCPYFAEVDPDLCGEMVPCSDPNGCGTCIDNPADPRCCQDGLVRTRDKLCRSPSAQVDACIQNILQGENRFLVVDGN